MVKKEVFQCDYCHKHSPVMTLGDTFPYVHGWRSMTNFEFKASNDFRHEIIMKHFCSNECLLSFISRFIHDQEDELQMARQQIGREQPLGMIANVINKIKN